MTRSVRIVAVVALLLGLAAVAALVARPPTSPPPGTSPPATPPPTESGTTQRPTETSAPSPNTVPVQAPVLVGAGDIGRCRDTSDEATAEIVARTPGTVFTAGDNAYPDGERQDFSACYAPGWGAFKERTRPALGNHDYGTPGAAAYFDYFGAAAGERGKGWYAFDLGTWRIYVLNSNCHRIDCDGDSEQVSWLRADLASHPSACVGAIWHHPRFSSSRHGNSEEVAPFWEALHAAGATWVVSGHDHVYERFAPQNSSAALDPAGIRQFVVGTGGANPYAFKSPQPNSEVRQTDLVGVIKLTLRAGRYDWEFLAAAGTPFHDKGSGTCSRR